MFGPVTAGNTTVDTTAGIQRPKPSYRSWHRPLGDAEVQEPSSSQVRAIDRSIASRNNGLISERIRETDLRRWLRDGNRISRVIHARLGEGWAEASLGYLPVVKNRTCKIAGGMLPLRDV